MAVTEVLQAEETAVVCSTTDGLEQDITIKDHVVERAVETSPLNLNEKMRIKKPKNSDVKYRWKPKEIDDGRKTFRGT